MKLRTPTVCPACGGEYQTTKLSCTKCNSELTGTFTGCAMCRLNDEELNFVLSFLRCQGSIKEMEKDLGISYPTVKNRLSNINQRLGLTDAKSVESIKQERLKIIDNLNQGKIDAKTAAQQIKEL